MQGRPYVRFLFAEDAVGDRPLVTLPTGDVVEDQYPVRPYGRLGQLAFVSDDNTNYYECSYLVYMATIVNSIEELNDAKANSKPVLQIMDLENDRVYESNKKTTGADILFIVDASGSMTQDMNRLKAAIPGLFRALDNAGCTDVRVGLMTYVTVPDVIQYRVGGSLWATYSGAAVSMFSNLAIWKGGNAHAASAVRWALEHYKFLDTASKKYIVVVTDTGRESDPITPNDVKDELISKGIILDVLAKDSGYYGPAATATGGEFINTNGVSDWTNILSDTLAGSLIGGILDTRPTVWTVQKNPIDPTQYLLPAQAIGIGHLVYDAYHESLWYVQPNGVFIKIASTKEYAEKDHNHDERYSLIDHTHNVIEAVASTNVEPGQLVFMDPDGRVRPAMWDSGKAVGFAMDAGSTGQTIRVQIAGIFEDYGRWILTPGTVYYQTDQGEMRWPDNLGNKYKHPAALAISSTSFIILTEIYMGGGGGGGGGGGQNVSISGVNVVRTETNRADSSSSVVPVIDSQEVLTEIFEDQDWTATTYMRKQYVTIRNTGSVQTLLVEISNTATNKTITEIILVGEELTFPIYDENWSIACRGEWDITVVTEVIAGILPMRIVTDTSDLPAGSDTYQYYDSTDGTTKYVVLGQIKKFDEDVAGELVLFDFPDWIATHITSEDYMIMGSIRLVNTSAEDTETVHVMKGVDLLYDFDLGPGEETLIELNREDVSFAVDMAGNVEAHLQIQATAYGFAEEE